MKKIPVTIYLLIILVITAIGVGALYFYLLTSLGRMGTVVPTPIKKVSPDVTINKETKFQARLERYFVKDGSQANFISSIDALCQTTNVTCKITALTEVPSGSASVDMLSLTLSSEGSLFDVESLMSDVGFLPYSIVITKTTISRNQNSTSGNILWDNSLDMTVPVILNK